MINEMLCLTPYLLLISDFNYFEGKIFGGI